MTLCSRELTTKGDTARDDLLLARGTGSCSLNEDQQMRVSKSGSRRSGAAVLVVLVGVALALDGPSARSADAAGPACSLEQLAACPWPELERLYRQAAPGAIPNGFARGRVVYPACEPFGGAKAQAASLVWRGKHFCTTDGTLINQWLGVRAIRARVGYGPSWLDGRPAIILDYACTSRRWADVRDEMREVGPGVYLGAMYLRRCPEPRLKLFFILEAEPSECTTGP
jgi:hypothetical protein